mgnify:CR=1 FL=1
MKCKRVAALFLASTMALSMSACTQSPERCTTSEGSQDRASCETLAEAVYPEMAQYPDETAYFSKTGEFDDEGFSAAYQAWKQDLKRQTDQPAGYQDGVDDFVKASTKAFLPDGEQNFVYSPLNVYMALSMLAELTDGESRTQIMDLLGQTGIEDVRAHAKALWNANYCADGAVTSVLASSLWLDEDEQYVQKTLDTLAQDYYASAFRGQMGDAAYNEALQSWVSDQTGGLLKEQASGLEFTPETVLGLVTTIYFRARWSEEFYDGTTSSGTFHTKSGDITCDFLHKSDSNTYYWGESFGAIELSLRGSGCMKLLLPDEGVSAESLLEDTEAMDFILSRSDWKNSKFLTVNLSLPKFDVSSDLDLKAGLKTLGVTDVFDASVADFTPSIENSKGSIFLSQTEHAARAAIDEEGVTAAAYTLIAEAGAAEPPDEEIDFTLDRPFVFVITSQDGLPLFIGVVHTPN